MNKFLPRAYGLYLIISVESHTPAVDEVGLPNSMSLARGTTTRSNNKKFIVDGGEDDSKVKIQIVKKEFPVREDKVAKTPRCDSDGPKSHKALDVNKSIDGHKPRAFRKFRTGRQR